MKPSRQNYTVFLYGYLALTLILIIINTYLPIYYLNVLRIPKEEVALVLLFVLLIFLIKPVLSIYFDTKPKMTRITALLGAICLVLSFSLLIFSLQSLFLFGIFLATSFGLLCLVDVSIDKYIVAISPNEKIKNNNVIWTQIGAALGGIFASGLYLISSNWNQFFIGCIILTIPLIFIVLLLKRLGTETQKSKEAITRDITKELKSKPILLMSIFLLLFTGDRLFDWVLEPWIDVKYGSAGVSLFSIFIMLWIFLQIIGFILGRYFSDRYSKKQIIAYLMVVEGIIYLIAPFMDIILLLVLFSISQLLAGIITVILLSLMIDLSKEKVILFQFMSTFVIIARVVFTPVGLLLYGFLPAEVIIAAAGICYAVSAIPLYMIKENDIKS
jgi:MFS family permease